MVDELAGELSGELEGELAAAVELMSGELVERQLKRKPHACRFHLVLGTRLVCHLSLPVH